MAEDAKDTAPAEAERPDATEKRRHLEGGEVHESAGVPHGHVEANGEMVVYIHDDDGNFVTWTKVPKDGFEAADDDVSKQAVRLARARGHKP